MISFYWFKNNVWETMQKSRTQKSIILLFFRILMDTTSWESYAIKSVDTSQQPQRRKTLLALQKAQFGEKAQFGLTLLILAVILELSVMVFPLSADMTDLDSIVRTMKLAQGFGFVVVLFKLAGLLLIISDIKNFILDVNTTRNQYNDNLMILAEKINNK